jgi:hypothetical protein
MPSNPGVKNIGIPSDAHFLLSKEAKRLKISQAEYTAAAVRYFAERGLDPVGDVAREGQLIMLQVKKLGDRIFSYMQVEERTILVPMLEEMLRSRVTLDRVLRMNEILVADLNRQLATMTQEQINAQRDAGKKLREQNEEAIARQVQEAIAATQQRAAAPPAQVPNDSLS